MSYTSLPLLVYGYSGKQEYVGSCLQAFGEKHEIECTHSQLPREIICDFSRHFTKHLKSKSGLVIELICDSSDCDNIEYFFGFAWRWIDNVNPTKMIEVQNLMINAFEKSMEGIEHPQATFNNVIYTY